MTLKLGIWKMNANGTEGQLEIGSVDPSTGVLHGKLNEAYVTGFWDETSRVLTFSMLTPLHRMFKGVLFSTPTNPQIGQDVLWTLAGLVEVADTQNAQGITGNAKRREFGWFAQITEVS